VIFKVDIISSEEALTISKTKETRMTSTEISSVTFHYTLFKIAYFTRLCIIDYKERIQNMCVR